MEFEFCFLALWSSNSVFLLRGVRILFSYSVEFEFCLLAPWSSNSVSLFPDTAERPKLNFQADIKMLDDHFTAENVGTECVRHSVAVTNTVKDTQWL